MKNIFRWTIGDVSRIGVSILDTSIIRAKKILEKFNFSFFICSNSENTLVDKLCVKHKVELIRTEWFSFPLPLDVIPESYDIYSRPGVPRGRQGSFWKLCPPRIDITSYELVCDNDLIIQKMPSELEEFLKSNKNLIIEENIFSFGKFSKFIDKPYNSGLYGLCPNYDFKHYLLKKWRETGEMQPLLSRDEQGLVIATLKSQDTIEIPKEKICFVLNEGETVSGEYEDIKENNFDCKIVKKINFKKPFFNKDIIHFLGANRIENHNFWSQYITNKII